MKIDTIFFCLVVFLIAIMFVILLGCGNSIGGTITDRVIIEKSDYTEYEIIVEGKGIIFNSYYHIQLPKDFWNQIKIGEKWNGFKVRK